MTAGCPRRPRTLSVAASEAGFTLLELMIVTVVLGILAMIGSQALRGVRERAMVAATVAELRHATSAIERYQLVSGAWPASIADLAPTGYSRSPDIEYCRFELRPAGGGTETQVALEAAHRASETVVTTLYPSWGNRTEEAKRKGGCGGNQGGNGKTGKETKGGGKKG